MAILRKKESKKKSAAKKAAAKPVEAKPVEVKEPVVAIKPKRYTDFLIPHQGADKKARRQQRMAAGLSKKG